MIRLWQLLAFCLGPLRDTHHFLLSFSAHSFIRPRDFSEKYCAVISSSQGGTILVFDSSHESIQPGGLNDPLTPFVCSVSDSTRPDSRNTGYLSPLNQLPSPLWAKSPINDDKIHSSPSIKI